MEGTNNISEAEWKVMEALWASPGLLLGEIRDALEGCGWSYSTIKTLVLRLIKKGVIRTEGPDKGRRYYAAVDEEDTRRNETRGLIDRIYNGSVRMMFSNLVKDSKLSESETKDLMELINKMDE